MTIINHELDHSYKTDNSSMILMTAESKAFILEYISHTNLARVKKQLNWLKKMATDFF